MKPTYGGTSTFHRIKEILHYYLLGFLMLMGYYLGDWVGLTDWAFKQPIHILLGVLTLYYGSLLWLAGSKLRKVLSI